MFNFLPAKIEIKNGIVTISRVPNRVMMNDLQRIFKTSRMSRHMFIESSSNVISFYEFFALELYYAIETLLESDRRINTSRRKLRQILELLKTQTWIKGTDEETASIVNYAHLDKFIYEPLAHQSDYFKKFEDTVTHYDLRGILLAAEPGTGKAQPLDSLIKVPGGWATMGDMSVGTEVVTPKGTTTVVTGVYPQGEVDIYRVTFYDGRTAECCGDHLWKVHIRNEAKTGYWKIKTIKEIVQTNSFQNNRVFVPLVEPEDNPDLNLPIDPYLLGVILGDGNISTGASIVITNPDSFIKEKVISRLPEGMCLGGRRAEIEYNLIGTREQGSRQRNPLLRTLDSLGLNRTLSHTKFIPAMYLEGSKQQRLDLLNGLMDTDGTADKSGSASFTSTSLDLAKSVQYLVRSLGGIATIVKKVKTFTYLGEKKTGLLAYQVNIRHKYPEELFSLPRKKERLSNENQYCANFKLRIEKIEHIGKKHAQCISVADEEHLYVTNDFVVTHNTLATLALSECLEVEKIIAICPNNAVETVWVKSVKGPGRIYKEDQDVYFMNSGKKYNNEKIIVVNYEALTKLDPVEFKLTGKKCSLILDESHSLNELSSNRTNLFLKLCQQLDCYVLFASGTPIKALTYETIPLLRAIDPLFTQDVENLFKKIFAGEATALSEILGRRLNMISHKVSKAVLNLAEPISTELRLKSPKGELYTLKAISKDIEEYVSKRTVEIVKLLPQFERTFYAYVDKTDAYMTDSKNFKGQVLKENIDNFRKYRDSIKQLNYRSRKNLSLQDVSAEIHWCNRFEKENILPRLNRDEKLEFKEAAVCFKYYQLKIKGECLGRVLGRKRIEAYRDVVASIPFEDIIETTEKKTLVFTSFVEVINETNRVLKAQGYKPLLMHGEFTNDLTSVVKRFEKNEEDNPLVATYNALSTAVPLIMADTLIAINPPYRDYIMKQAIARINRLGTTGQTRIFNITLDTGSEPNICDRMLDIVKWSKDQANKVLSLDIDDIEDTNISLESFHEFDNFDLVTQSVATETILAKW